MPGQPDQEALQQDIINIRTLLCALRGVLLEDLQVGNSDENDNFDSLESEELISVANVIDKLSLTTSNIVNDTNDNTDESVKDITDKAIRQTLEENEDLKRQNILLEQQVEEKERRIKALERVLLTEEKSYNFGIKGRKSLLINTASQVITTELDFLSSNFHEIAFRLRELTTGHLLLTETISTTLTSTTSTTPSTTETSTTSMQQQDARVCD